MFKKLLNKSVKLKLIKQYTTTITWTDSEGFKCSISSTGKSLDLIQNMSQRVIGNDVDIEITWRPKLVWLNTKVKIVESGGSELW